MRIKRGGQINNRVSRGRRYGSWKWIRGIAGYYFWYETIINGHGKGIQIWTTTINWKQFVEAVINCPALVLSQ